MTVENTKPVAVLAYTGPGRYDFDFLVYEDSDLSVSYVDVNGAVTLLERLIDYSVVKNVLPNEGGHIDTTAPLATTGFLDIRRSVPLTQPEEWSAEGYLKLDKLETSLDRLVMMVQQVSEVVDSGSATSNWRGDWATAESYLVRDLVRAPNGNWYVAVSSHTSGVFVTDLADGKWRIAIDIADIGGVNIPDPSTGRKGQAVVVNPTLDGYELGAGGGLSWSIKTANYTTSPGEGHLVDTSSASVTGTIHSAPGTGDTIAVGDLKGTFAINNCTIAMTGLTLHGVVQTADMVLDVKNQRVTLVYSGATDGWVITELEPNNSQFEYMPYAVMYVQEQKPQGTGAGTNIVGDNLRNISNIIQSDISGASLDGSGGIILPAGEYQIDGYAMTGYLTTTDLSRLYIKDSAGAILLRGGGSQTGYVINNSIKGKITLTAQTTIKLYHYLSAIRTNGLGLPVSQGTEVYSELVITKIGGNYAPRLITTDARLQMVAGLDYTGNMLGFDISKTGANQLTVTKGTCKDRLGVIDLYLTTDTTVAIPAVANTIYHLAVVRLLNQTMTVKAYASEAAMAADATIDAFRWIGEWLTNGGTTCVEGVMVNGLMLRGKASECVISANITTTYATVSHTAQITPGRVEAIEYGAADAATAAAIYASITGTSTEFHVGTSSAGAGDTGIVAWGNSLSGLKPFNTSRQFKSDSGTLDLLVHQVKYRR